MRWPCASSLALKEMSRVISRPASTMSMPPMSPPSAPMAEVTFPSMPGELTMRTRTVRL